MCVFASQTHDVSGILARRDRLGGPSVPVGGTSAGHATRASASVVREERVENMRIFLPRLVVRGELGVYRTGRGTVDFPSRHESDPLC